MRVPALLSLASLATGCAGPASHRPMQLRRVVLYQNGIGYFERAGHLTGETLRLSLARGELDDVLKTLTVIDRLGAGVATVDVPAVTDDARSVTLGVRMSAGRVHDVKVSYAVPTPTWKAAYRVVLSDEPGDARSLLQGWAMVNNVSQEDWTGVQLTLATGAPMSFVHDLHTPEFVKRPDVHGNLIAPVLGPIDNEKAGAADTDHDGILDAVDRCPDSPEDLDGHDDGDGCPEADMDGDRIPDAIDRCPTEPETYNGTDDEDGCPDRGHVSISNMSLEVREQIVFPKDSDAIDAGAAAILDAIAATLRGNPDLVKIELGGHASADERDAWAIAARRASAVRRALLGRGVEARRLVLVPYGTTRPLDAGATEHARARNRRVEFHIAQRQQVTPPPRVAPMRIDPATAKQAVHTKTTPAEVAGMVSYVLGEPVTIRKGMSSLVSILNKPIDARDVYLWRPDPKAPGSDKHPFRAVRLVNDSGFMLEPGPLAIFARGTFVGDSVVGRLAADETAWIPYALDGATTVTTTRDDAERPVRIVSIQRGLLVVENAGIRTTRYVIAAGRMPAKVIYLRHGKAAGFAAGDLPPGTLDRGDAYLVPLPLEAAQESTLTIVEREPRRHTLQLLDAGATELGLYVDGSALPPAIADKLRAAIALRKEMGALEEAIEAHRVRLGDLSERAEELRANLKSLDKVRGADDFKKQLIASLTVTTADADTAAKRLGEASEALATTRGRLAEAIREVTLDEL